MGKLKVVVTDFEYEDLRFEERVFQVSPDIELVPAQCRTEEEVIAACADADGLLNQYAPITGSVIAELRKCKVIARYGVGYNTVDIEAATAKGIYVANVPDYCQDEVSDHALALLLNAARKVSLADRTVKGGAWNFNVTKPIGRIRGKTLGLVGFGAIAQFLAEKARPLGLQTIAYDPYVPEETARRLGTTLVPLERLCREADFISVHAPLLDSTRGMIGREQFALMKREAVIVNTSRGPVIDEAAMIEALQGGRIAGAGLDVLENEPVPPDSPLLSMEQVTLTPHVAWYSEESAAELRTKAAMGVLDVLANGRPPRYLVNKQLASSK